MKIINSPEGKYPTVILETSLLDVGNLQLQPDGI